jgi:hypothetical protein
MTPLQQQDPEIWHAIQGERSRQKYGLEMIASENYTSSAVMQAQGTVLTNKYAEGYPGKNIMVVVNLLMKPKSWRSAEPSNFLVQTMSTYNLMQAHKRTQLYS